MLMFARVFDEDVEEIYAAMPPSLRLFRDDVCVSFIRRLIPEAKNLRVVPRTMLDFSVHQTRVEFEK